VECAGLVRTASVRWSEGKRFGLLFDRALLDADLDAIAARGSVALSPRAAG
jgi:hypothetical protein